MKVDLEPKGRADDLSAVKRDASGGLVATSCSVNLCDCGCIWIGGHDQHELEFVQLPISADVARAIAADLLEIAAGSDAITGARPRHQH